MFRKTFNEVGEKKNEEKKKKRELVCMQPELEFAHPDQSGCSFLLIFFIEKILRKFLCRLGHITSTLEV